mmetsp:Transcript_16018/g.25096  ORF Transcript_16018/g.25096 Transcript_16018/m.25096 type:complete len:211 (+) Transcript_16018:237-869(+)
MHFLPGTCVPTAKKRNADRLESTQEETALMNPTFWDKIAGVGGAKRPPVPPAQTVLLSGIGGLGAIGSLAFLHHFVADQHQFTLMLGSFGASAVLLFGAPTAPFSQPAHVIGGHMISAFLGVLAVKTFGPDVPYITGPVSVGAAIMAMQLTNTVHPPAGGTALIAVLGPAFHPLGFSLLIPTFVGSTVLVGSALIFNNLFRGSMRYPQYW